MIGRFGTFAWRLFDALCTHAHGCLRLRHCSSPHIFLFPSIQTISLSVLFHHLSLVLSALLEDGVTWVVCAGVVELSFQPSILNV